MTVFVSNKKLTPHNKKRIIRRPQVRERINVSNSKLYEMVAKGQFPKPFVIIPGGRAVGWIEDDVDAWINERFNNSREV